MVKSPTTYSLIPRLKPCPQSGEGVHRWLYYAAATLLPYYAGREEYLAEVIEEMMTRPPNPRTEAEDTVRSVIRAVTLGEAGLNPKRKHITFDVYRARAASARLHVTDYEGYLRDRSAVDPASVSLRDFLEVLYQPDEVVLLCNHTGSQGRRYTVGSDQNLESFAAGESGAWFLANPVSGETTMNPRTGRPSRRSKENITTFRYSLIESDQMSENEWTAILAQLPLPIVSITHSGGKSLHALARVNAESEKEYEEVREKLREALVPLGACEASLSSVRLTRLPGFFRGEREQKLLFLNPGADGTPISTRAERRSA